MLSQDETLCDILLHPLGCVFIMEGIMKNTRVLVFASFFVVLEVILTQYLGITFPTMRFTLTFIPMAICGFLMGPWIGMGVAVTGDLLGMLLWPKGPFFIGFTIASAVSGFLFGLIHKKEGNALVVWIVVVTCLNSLLANILITSYSLTFITEAPLGGFIAPRLVKAAVELPIRILILIPVIHQMKRLKSRFNIF